MKTSFLFVVYLFLLTVMPARLHAEDAQDFYEQALVAFEELRYEEAAVLFQKAYDIKPTWKLLFNIGQSLAAAKDYGRALIAFERYLAEGGDDVTDTRMAEVDQELGRLRKLVGYVKITAPAGSRIVIDGVHRGTAPFASEIPLSIGVEHTVVMGDGDGDLTRAITVRVGVTSEVRFEEEDRKEPADAMEKGTAPLPEPAPVQAEPNMVARGPAPLRVGGWVLVGVAGALLVSGGITGGLALSMDRDLADRCDGIDCSGADWTDAQKMRSLGVATDVMLGVGGALAIAGVVMLVAGTKRERNTADHVSFRPLAAVGCAGGWLTGEF